MTFLKTLSIMKSFFTSKTLGIQVTVMFKTFLNQPIDIARPL